MDRHTTEPLPHDFDHRAITPVTGLRTMILYQDREGTLTRRRITMLKLSIQHGHPVLYSICNECDELRGFRVASILEFVTPDGEVVATDSFWTLYGIDPVEAAHVNAAATASKNRISRIQNAHLVILTGLSDCDGLRHHSETERILSYLEIELEGDGVFMDERQIASLKRKIRNMQPDGDRVDAAIQQVFGRMPVGGAPRTELRERQRLLRAVREVIEADGNLHDSEIEFLNDRFGLDDDLITRTTTPNARNTPPAEVPGTKGTLFSGQTFVFTGHLDIISRAEVRSVVEAAGGKVAGAVSGATTYLVVGHTTMSNAKIAAAKKHGIRILDEAAFVRLVRP